MLPIQTFKIVACGIEKRGILALQANCEMTSYQLASEATAIDAVYTYKHIFY